MEIMERFWLKVDKNGPIPESRPELGPCWIWIGSRQGKGYGTFRIGSRTDGSRRSVLAHKFLFETIHGAVPTGLELDHLCRVRACVNPDHLEAVGHNVNVQRGDSPAQLRAWQAAKTHCPHGHPYSGTNLYFAPGTAHRQCRACRSKNSADGHRKAGDARRLWENAYRKQRRQERSISTSTISSTS